MEDAPSLMALKWWFLSFYSDWGQPMQKFLGANIVEGFNIPHACHNAHELGINPGGMVVAQVYEDRELPDDTWRERLLTAEETNQALAIIERNRQARLGHRTDN